MEYFIAILVVIILLHIFTTVFNATNQKSAFYGRDLDRDISSAVYDTYAFKTPSSCAEDTFVCGGCGRKVCTCAYKKPPCGCQGGNSNVEYFSRNEMVNKVQKTEGDVRIRPRDLVIDSHNDPPTEDLLFRHAIKNKRFK